MALMNQPTSRDVFTSTIEIKPEHLDVQGHVNNAMYVQWIQDVAVQHWLERVGDQDAAQKYWVVLEHLIQYKQQVFNGETLEVETYVETPAGIRFPRIVNFRRDGKLVVAARTLWCWVDADSHRPRRIPQEFLTLFGLHNS